MFCTWLLASATCMFCTSLIGINYLYSSARYFANLSCFVLLSLLIYCNILEFWGSAGFGFGDGFSSESVFGADSGSKFGFWFWVPRYSTRSEPTPLPSLILENQTKTKTAAIS
jgi:hypothetical protein